MSAQSIASANGRSKGSHAAEVPPEKKRAPLVLPIPDRLRWTLEEAAAMLGKSPPYIREIEAKHEFPPRIDLPAMRGGTSSKSEFIAAEVRAFAEGRDWRSMVDARNGWRDPRGA